MRRHTYTRIEEAGVTSCNDCGAFAKTEDAVVHHATCNPGESKKWEQFYDEANEEEEAYYAAHNCPGADTYYDAKLGISRCRNCGWTS